MLKPKNKKRQPFDRSTISQNTKYESFLQEKVFKCGQILKPDNYVATRANEAWNCNISKIDIINKIISDDIDIETIIKS